ncbi:hypothetical protein ACIRQY_05180 [Streptomyces sp. NPDC101490]|uniref:hypothetical protein n=1 Tax=Streptomyces sp. NPDC101490 TaxID=3366143 RepID=UPI003816DABD
MNSRPAYEMARALNSYVGRYPDEAWGLMSLWSDLKAHAKAGGCVHQGACPAPRISPVVLDEHFRVLMLQGRNGPRLPEAGASEEFEAFPTGAVTLARALGVDAPTEHTGLDEAIHVKLGLTPVADGLRTRVSFRYLYRTIAARCAFAAGAPQMWVPLDEADPELSRRVHSLVAAVAAR